MYMAICSDLEDRDDGTLNLSACLLPDQAIEDNCNLQDTLQKAATYRDKAKRLQTEL